MGGSCTSPALHKRKLQEASGPGDTSSASSKPRIVVLGSGWGAFSFMKSLSKHVADKYDIVLVSPRNYFLYTPLLPASATGTVEERSITEPIRNTMLGKGQYYEAECRSVDVKNKQLMACTTGSSGFSKKSFQLSYDHLVVSVGAVPNTFGVKGVAESCVFFKDVAHASQLRAQLCECFERAALPNTTEEERAQLLSFVVVGGGPTGVEVAAEMHDMVAQDMARLYPWLMRHVRIRIVDSHDHVLSMFDRKISEFAGQLFAREGIDLVFNSRVTAVDEGRVTIRDKQKQRESQIKFGLCLWSTGIATHPLVRQIQDQMPEQNHAHALLTDERLQVLGSEGSIWALGDASTVFMPHALDHADELFEEGDVSRNGTLSLAELRGLLQTASHRYPQLAEHARFLSDRQGDHAHWGSLLHVLGRRNKGHHRNLKLLESMKEDTEMTREQFKDLLKTIDLGLRGLPATAQVASQQGKWLAQGVFAQQDVWQGKKVPAGLPAFTYAHKGAMAYVGQGQAVIDFTDWGQLYGLSAGYLWKGFETYSQFSWRSRALVFSDWLRTKVFGRDISSV